MNKLSQIVKNYQAIRAEVPDYVAIVLAAKKRTVDQVRAAIEAGATDIGENYVQEAQAMRDALGDMAGQATWHMIGHLQKNKINKAVACFDVFQTLDSLEKAMAINQRVEALGGKCLPVFLEVNIANEASKRGIVLREDQSLEDTVRQMAEDISQLSHIQLTGLMTMGPWCEDPEDLRPHFRKAKKLFDLLKGSTAGNVSLKHLSMGMSSSYQVAIEEGANMIRIGTRVFGERPK